jgi:hypothetical protein
MTAPPPESETSPSEISQPERKTFVLMKSALISPPFEAVQDVKLESVTKNCSISFTNIAPPSPSEDRALQRAYRHWDTFSVRSGFAEVNENEMEYSIEIAPPLLATLSAD